MSEEIPRMDPGALIRRQANGEPTYVVDVRRHPDDHQIAGAAVYDPEALLAADRVILPIDPDQLVVSYCT